MNIQSFAQFTSPLPITEDDKKWAQGVKVKKGKMTRMLDIPDGDTVTSVYKGDPEKLAKDLYKATGSDKSEANGMLAFAGNVSHTKPNIFTKAQQALEIIDGDKK